MPCTEVGVSCSKVGVSVNVSCETADRSFTVEVPGAWSHSWSDGVMEVSVKGCLAQAFRIHKMDSVQLTP